MITNHKYFTEYPEGNIVTKHLDIFNNGVILDLTTPDNIYYLEFDSKHRCTTFIEYL